MIVMVEHPQLVKLVAVMVERPQKAGLVRKLLGHFLAGLLFDEKTYQSGHLSTCRIVEVDNDLSRLL